IKNDLQKLKGKDIGENVALVSNATTIAPGMYNLDPVTLACMDKNNRETHIYYLKHTMEQDDILREIVEQAKSLNPLDSASYSTGRTFTLVGNAYPLTRITTTNEALLKEPIPLEIVAQEPVVTKVYTRRPKVPKTIGSNSKPKIAKSMISNKTEPDTSSGSNTSVAPSSSSLVNLSDIGGFSLDKRREEKLTFYNRCTRKIIETIHADFDELTTMASKQLGSRPRLQLMTPTTYSSGLVSNPIPQQPCNPPKRDDWNFLFQPMFDEYFNPLTIVVSPVLVTHAPGAINLAYSPVSMSID
ncbi:hypothetical protein Tco_0816191, partial [Tanacetum coccineum]